MLCTWCGMESVTTDQCSWCHRVFSTAPAETSLPAEARAETGVEASAATPVSQESSVPSSDAPPVEEESPIAPWTIAPPAPAVPIPTPPASANADPEADRPIIGVRRPADRRSGPHRPAPGMPPAAPRTSSPGVAHSGPASRNTARTPAPAMPAPLGVNRAGSGAARSPAPATGKTRPVPAAPLTASPAAGQASESAPVATRPVPTSRPAVPAALTGARTARAESSAPAGLAATVAPPDAGRKRTELGDAEVNVPSLGTFTPAQSKYYVGQLVDPISGAHYDSETGQPTAAPMGTAVAGDGMPLSADESIEIIEETESGLPALMRYLGAFAVILGVTALFAFAYPTSYVMPMLTAEFFAAMLLPILRVAPWADEDSGDVVLFILLTLACGPVVALVIYGVLSLLRQDTNPGILGCLAVALVVRVTVDLARWASDPTVVTLSPAQYAPFAEVGHFDLRAILINWSGMVALAGWYMASIFHRLDE